MEYWLRRLNLGYSRKWTHVTSVWKPGTYYNAWQNFIGSRFLVFIKARLTFLSIYKSCLNSFDLDLLTSTQQQFRLFKVHSNVTHRKRTVHVVLNIETTHHCVFEDLRKVLNILNVNVLIEVGPSDLSVLYFPRKCNGPSEGNAEI
jgi:hypothetical protein